MPFSIKYCFLIKGKSFQVLNQFCGAVVQKSTVTVRSSTWQTLLFDKNMRLVCTSKCRQAHTWVIPTTHSWRDFSPVSISDVIRQPYPTSHWSASHIILSMIGPPTARASRLKMVHDRQQQHNYKWSVVFLFWLIIILATYDPILFAFQYIVPCSSGNEQRIINKDYLVWKSLSLPAGYHKEISSILADQ